MVDAVHVQSYYDSNNIRRSHMLRVKVRKFGNSLGIVLPKEVLKRLHAGDGQPLFLIEATGGAYRLTPYDPEFERQMEIAEQGMTAFRNTLHALAK
jgi:putative addiction module antidote